MWGGLAVWMMFIIHRKNENFLGYVERGYWSWMFSLDKWDLNMSAIALQTQRLIFFQRSSSLGLLCFLYVSSGCRAVWNRLTCIRFKKADIFRVIIIHYPNNRRLTRSFAKPIKKRSMLRIQWEGLNLLSLNSGRVAFKRQSKVCNNCLRLSGSFRESLTTSIQLVLL